MSKKDFTNICLLWIWFIIYIGLFLFDGSHGFRNTMTFSTVWFLQNDYDGIKSFICKLEAKETYYRDYKKFSLGSLRVDFALSLYHASKDKDSFFEEVLMKTLNKHAPMNKKFIRANQVPYFFLTVIWLPHS